MVGKYKGGWVEGGGGRGGGSPVLGNRRVKGAVLGNRGIGELGAAGAENEPKPKGNRVENSHLNNEMSVLREINDLKWALPSSSAN